MSLEESNNLNLLDAEPVIPILEASSLPKFDMHLYKSSLTETNIKWLTKCYGILANLHSRLAPKGMTINTLPDDAIGLYAYHFQQGGLRAARLPLLPLGSARITHLSSPAKCLEDLPPKTGDMVTAELPCHKVKKVVRDKVAGKEGAQRKRRVRVGTLVHPTLEHVSSPIPLNHEKPLKILANEQYVSSNASAGRGEDFQENVDAAFANEGHGDNEGAISGLQTQPSPSCPADQLLENVEKPSLDKVMLEVEL
nr:hypothetical protein [Tanacetum cinerariifolium]